MLYEILLICLFAGKTLAFGLAIIDTLFEHWSEYGDTRSPYAIILAPTRELAIQITSVLTDLCKVFKGTQRRVEIVNVVGGMSEHKQRRQLDDTKGRGRPVHIMVSAVLVHSTWHSTCVCVSCVVYMY